MHLVNLTLSQLSLLAASGIVLIVALYLEDRYYRKKTVSSLQFWALLPNREGQRGGKRIRDISSLLLQLFSLLALLLAVARPEAGSSVHAGKSHVLLLDTSAWTLQSNGHGTILDREKALALEYMRTLPASDGVMLTRVDGMVVPLTPFTTNRALLRQKLFGVEPSLLALNQNEALSFAKQTGAEIVYIGPARIRDAPGTHLEVKNFQALVVEARPAHCGIHHVGLARDEMVPSNWEMLVVLRNYGINPCDLVLQATVSGASLAVKKEHLAPGADVRTEYRFASAQSEPLAITLMPDDGLASDHHVGLQLAGLAPTRIAVYTSRPNVIEDLVKTVPNARVSLRKESDYRPDVKDADLVILDRILNRLRPVGATLLPTLWIRPAADGSPFVVKSTVVSPGGVSWNSRTPVAQGLHSEDLPLPPADVYQLAPADTPILSVREGPVVALRPAQDRRPRSAVLGFDPADDKVRYHLPVPLLFLNLVRWLSVEQLEPSYIEMSPAGAGQIELGEGESVADVQVARPAVLPLVAQGRHVQFFAMQALGIDFFHQGRKERLYTNLPDLAETVWKPFTRHTRNYSAPALYALDGWRWLVLAGLATTLLEWWLFARAGKGSHEGMTSRPS